MIKLPPNAVRTLIRSAVPNDMQISSSAIAALTFLLESYLEDMVRLYGTAMVEAAVDTCKSEGRRRLMGHHFEPDLLGARSAIRPILGDIQINGDALEKLVAGIDLITEEDLSKIRRAGILRAKTALLRRAEEATAHARARGARRITVEDVTC
jgi:histone H3/H4